MMRSVTLWLVRNCIKFIWEIDISPNRVSNPVRAEPCKLIFQEDMDWLKQALILGKLSELRFSVLGLKN